MANLRESLASTGMANLSWDEDYERAIDRVAACGKCESLGVDLWKARYMLEVSAYHRCRWELLKRVLARYKHEDRGIAQKLVDQALIEFIASFCPTCGGAREIMLNELRVLCDTCGGSGVRRYSDYDRCRMMQISYRRYQSLQHKLSWIQRVIEDSEKSVNYRLNVELERDANGKDLR